MHTIVYVFVEQVKARRRQCKPNTALQGKRIKFWTAAIALKWLITYSNGTRVNAQSNVDNDLSPDQLKRMGFGFIFFPTHFE